MAYILFDGQNDFFRTDWNSLNSNDFNKAKTSQNVFYTAFSIAVATYAYDVIHGDWVLHKKQEGIRYKYAIQAKLSSSRYNTIHSLYPSLAFNLQF